MNELIKRYPALSAVKDKISEAVTVLTKTFENGGKLLLCGNGGSAADCDHIVGELMKSFKIKRPVNADLTEKLRSAGTEGALLSSLLEASLPAISLCCHSALSTAYSNDRDACAVYAQQLSGYGKKGDTLLVLTTSGNSKNCVYAAVTAKAMGINVISITGSKDGKIDAFSDILIKLPESETYLVQELTLPVYHYLCAELEKHFFGKAE